MPKSVSDAILISLNAIDYISWEEHCALIAASPGLLTTDGVFAFSHDLSGVDTQRGFHLRSDLRESLNTLYRLRSIVRLQTKALRASGLSRVERIQPWLRDEPAYFNYFACQR
jgi:hypothetical protein